MKEPCSICGRPSKWAKIIGIQAPRVGPDEFGAFDGYGEVRCDEHLSAPSQQYVKPARPLGATREPSRTLEGERTEPS